MSATSWTPSWGWCRPCAFPHTTRNVLVLWYICIVPHIGSPVVCVQGFPFLSGQMVPLPRPPAADGGQWSFFSLRLWQPQQLFLQLSSTRHHLRHPTSALQQVLWQGVMTVAPLLWWLAVLTGLFEWSKHKPWSEVPLWSVKVPVDWAGWLLTLSPVYTAQGRVESGKFYTR